MSWSTVLGRCAVVSLSAGAAVIFATGCSGEVRARIMHFFFEYPPPADSADSAGPAARPTTQPSTSVEESPVRVEPARRLASRHPPFIKRECQNCHIRGLGQSPRPDFMAACQECHKRLFAYHRFAHAPAVAHECRRCHFMHVSPYKKLLKEPQAVLCTHCHPAQQNVRALNSYHKGIAAVRCTSCHDPHFADNQLLLKPEKVRRHVRRVAEQALAHVTSTQPLP